MEQAFPYGDLVVLGAIAAFIILRYRSILGKKTGHDMSKPKVKVEPPKPQERVIQMPQKEHRAAVVVKAKEDIALADIDDAEISSALAKMKQTDENFTISDFMDGAKAAFDMVVEAFSTHDKDTLKSLLSKEIYKEFEESISEQQKEKRRAQNTLVSIKKAEITEAEMSKNIATITVRFDSEQINVIVDEEGKVIEGNLSDIHDIEDEWVFERDMKSRNPNWTIIDT